MNDKFENDFIRFKNKMWGMVPEPLKFLIILLVILISAILLFKPLMPNNKPLRPHLLITLTNNYLELYPKRGTFALSYKLKNSSDEVTAYNIKKGHMIFDSSKDTCKPFYEPKNIIDVLQPKEESGAHKDDIGFLHHDKTYFAQFIMTYSASKKDIKGKKYYSLVNYEIRPKGNNELAFLILQKSKDASENPINERMIINSIKNCQFLKDLD